MTKLTTVTVTSLLLFQVRRQAIVRDRRQLCRVRRPLPQHPQVRRGSLRLRPSSGGHHNCGGLNQHHSRSVPSVAAAVANSSSGGCSGGGGGSGSGAGQHACDPYASRTSLNHEIAMNSSSSRPQSRSHSHHCQQQGCADYPSG